MGKLNIEFINDESGFFSRVENDLEQRLISKIKTDNFDYESMDNDEYMYLSTKRYSLFSWYPFEKNSRFLEIGAEFGAVTEWLSQYADTIDILEKKITRTKVLEERFKNNCKIRIIRNLDDTITHDFDYIIVHDITGFLCKYITSDYPYRDFLLFLNRYLSKNGRILIATENRLGLKYFSGSVEDYSHKFFTGINEFNNYDFIGTLSRNEWIRVLCDTDFNYQFYYPFPDLIFPWEIFSDKSISSFYYGGKYRDYSCVSFDFFDEELVYESLMREGCIQSFANCFILELSHSELSDVNYYYCKNGIETKIKKTTVKKRIHDELIDLLFGVSCGNNHDKELISKFNSYAYLLTQEIKKSFLKGEGLYKPDMDFRSIYRHNDMLILPSVIRDGDYEIDYVIWSMWDRWYQECVFPYGRRYNRVHFDIINKALSINPERELCFRNKLSKYRKENTDEVTMHCRPRYRRKFVSEIDVALQGEEISEEIHRKDVFLEQLLEENYVLDWLRKKSK